MIEPGETQEYVVTLDAAGLPAEPFEGEFVFLHDGVGAATHIPVTLNVVEGPVQADYILHLNLGWNMVSTYLAPDEEDVRVLMRPIAENDAMIMMKDGQGRFYHVELGFCNIPFWNVADGYLVKMNEAAEITLSGMTVVYEEPIPLQRGWQMISCYLRYGVDARVALSGLGDNLLIAKDGDGHFYIPAWDFSNMGDMIHGRGYLVKLEEDQELIYRAEDPDEMAGIFPPCAVGGDQGGGLPTHPNTSVNASLLILADGLDGADVGVYAAAGLVGSGVVADGRCGIAVWGDDPTTEAVDGAVAGQPLTIKVFAGQTETPATVEYLTGDGAYRTDDFQAVQLTASEVPTAFGIVSAWPNPFNATTRLTFNLPEAAKVDLALFDLNGRRVLDVAAGEFAAGAHVVSLDASAAPSGTYLARLTANGRTAGLKVTLVK